MGFLTNRSEGGRTTEIRDSIYIFDNEQTWLKILIQDIYYIETIKSTHYCEVVMKDGRGKIHADITPLQKILPEYFFRTRASTLANMKLVQKVDTAKRILYFDDEASCTYTERVSKEIKRILRLRSYRNYGGG